LEHCAKLLRALTITSFLNIPDLVKVVRQWDNLVRAQLPGTNIWYAHVTSDGMALEAPRPCPKKDSRIDRGLHKLCDLAGVEFKSAHKLRHGFAVYCLERSKDTADMEAISKTLMHSSLMTTFEIYAVLDQTAVKSRIGSFTE